MHNNCETISNSACLIEDVPFSTNSAVMKRADREVKDKICTVCFELAENQSACLRCPIINIIFDYAERTSVR